MTGECCQGFWGCLWAYQTLASGALAVLAAVGTALVIYFSARLPIKAREKRERELDARRLTVGCLALQPWQKTEGP